MNIFTALFLSRYYDMKDHGATTPFNISHLVASSTCTSSLSSCRYWTFKETTYNPTQSHENEHVGGARLSSWLNIIYGPLPYTTTHHKKMYRYLNKSSQRSCVTGVGWKSNMSHFSFQLLHYFQVICYTGIYAWAWCITLFV